MRELPHNGSDFQQEFTDYQVEFLGIRQQQRRHDFLKNLLGRLENVHELTPEEIAAQEADDENCMTYEFVGGSQDGCRWRVRKSDPGVLTDIGVIAAHFDGTATVESYRQKTADDPRVFLDDVGLVPLNPELLGP